MDSKTLIEKYKYYKIQNNMIRKHKIQNKDKSPKIKMNIPIKANKCEYFPIESDKSKADGQTIYLVTEESNYNNNPQGNINNTQIDAESKPINIYNNEDMLIEKDYFYNQRNIELKINKPKLKQIKNKIENNNINISENINNENNIFFNNYDYDDIAKDVDNKENNIKINLNINPININSFNTVNANQINEEHKSATNTTINDFNKKYGTSKTPMYKKKIKFNYKKLKKEEENSEQNIKSKSEIFNKFTEIQKGRNDIKEEKDNLRKEEKISLTEAKKKEEENNKTIEKNSISINNSLQDIFTTTNFGIMNRSFNEINYNIDSLYKSLDFVQHHIIEDLNNSKIMENNFLNGLKNQERKNSLKKAMDRYNRFRSLGKLGKKKNLTNSPNLGVDKEITNEKKDEKIIEVININNKKEINNEEIMKEENKISNIEEDENENEFSFNSELKKFEKKNNLENIAKEDNNKISNDLIENSNKDNNSKDEKAEIIKEEQKDKEKEDEKELKLKEENQQEINKEEINKEELDKEKIEKEKEDKEEIQKEIEKEKDNIENNDKIFINQEVKIPNDIIDNNQQEEIILNKNENNSNNNIINNSINININNESHIKNKINNQNKLFPINNKKYKPNLKPGYFIRKVVREEHYYVDENGKEKILQVKQEYINNEDKKKMKLNAPYKKKYINLGNFINNNNTSFNSIIVKEKENDDMKFKNELNKEINVIYRNDESFEENEYKRKQEKENKMKKDIKSFQNKIYENHPVPILTHPQEIYNNKYNLNENYNNYFNSTYNNTSDSYKSKNIYFSNHIKDNTNVFKSKYNQIRENRNNFNLTEATKSLNLKNKPEITKHNTCKMNSKIITKPKNLENKTRLVKPKIKNDYFNNYQLTIKDLNNSNINLNSNTMRPVDTIEQSFKNLNTINTIDNYIKVNKVDKFQRLKTEQNLKKVKKININNNAINPSYINNRKKRESSKNHTYKEINLTNINKPKSKLSSNSFSHYYPSETTDDLNTSNNTNKFSITTNTSDRNNILKYSINPLNQNSRKNIDINREGNLSNKSSSSSLLLNYRITNNRFNKNDKIQTELNSSNNRVNHNYYESKSSKKDKNFNYMYNNNDYKRKINNYKEINRNNYDNLNNKEKKGKAFYSYYEIK